MSLCLQPITLAEANAFVQRHHRHHGRVVGWKFGVGVTDGRRVVGVGIASRPVARGLDDGWTVEVTRCCTDGTRNAASMIYGALSRAARALGYKRVITYTLREEAGTSLKGAGWRALYDTRGGSWSCLSRPRVDTHPLGQKTLWEAPA